MNRSLEGYVCLVTGASRRLGQSMALGLGEAGATVYITGRTLDSANTESGSLKETARLIEGSGGKAIAVAVDHSDDSQVAGLFHRIGREQQGRLDVLVNNAFSATQHLMSTAGDPDSDDKQPARSVGELAYWEPSPVINNSSSRVAGGKAPTAVMRTPAEEWDLVNRVGLRNAYTCCVLATRLMLDYRRRHSVGRSDTGRERLANGDFRRNGDTSTSKDQSLTKPTPPGLIINISSLGGTVRVFNVAFCAGKSALDRMTVEMARDLRSQGIDDIAVISLIPELVGTKIVNSALAQHQIKQFDVSLAVPPVLVGHVVAALAAQTHQRLLRKSGRCLLLSEQARELGLKYTSVTNATESSAIVRQRYPANPRSVKRLLWSSGWHRLSSLVPEFVTVPFWVILLVTSKF